MAGGQPNGLKTLLAFGAAGVLSMQIKRTGTRDVTPRPEAGAAM